MRVGLMLMVTVGSGFTVTVAEALAWPLPLLHVSE
jgi:hypothetical protein